MLEVKTGDIVLCTVKRIEGTTVFFDIESNGEGNMPMSEVAAGRIRNLREYVAPNKKVVCKILSLEKGHIQLSLRRVTAKEREQALERHKKENVCNTVLKTIVKDPTKVIEQIKEKYELADFFDEARANPSLLQEFFKKEEAAKLQKMIAEKEERQKAVKSVFILKTLAPSGLADIKEILGTNAGIKYLGSSKFMIEITGKDFKEAHHKLQEILKSIEQKAKDKKMQFEVKENK